MQKIGNDTSLERSVTSHYHGSKILDHNNGDLKQ